MNEAPTNDLVLKEIRSLRMDFNDLSLQIRVDTPWVRFKSHIRYALNSIAEIPTLARMLVFGAAILLTISSIFSIPDEVKKKLRFFALDMVMLAIVVIQQP